MTSDFGLRTSDFRRTRRRGFSFVEVLFAVMILGIGFIMLAGIFPVALSQSQTTADETVGAAVARGAVEYLSTLPYSSQLMRSPQPGTPTDPSPASDGEFHPMWDVPVRVVIDAAGNTIQTSLWQQVRGNLILPEDPRYGWVAFWRRPNDVTGKPANYAQVVVVAVRVRTHDAYDFQFDVVNGSVPTLMGYSVTVNNLTDLENGDQIALNNGGDAAASAAPYGYVLMAGGLDAANRPIAGRIYRLGNESGANPTVRTFDLLPGSDMTVQPGNDGVYGTGDDIKEDVHANRPAFIIGQGLRDPTRVFNNDETSPQYNPYEGGAQDVAIYSSFIRLN